MEARGTDGIHRSGCQFSSGHSVTPARRTESPQPPIPWNHELSAYASTVLRVSCMSFLLTQRTGISGHTGSVNLYGAHKTGGLLTIRRARLKCASRPRTHSALWTIMFDGSQVRRFMFLCVLSRMVAAVSCSLLVLPSGTLLARCLLLACFRIIT